MRFSRFQIPKPGKREIKPGYGERKRTRELQKIPLFPGLVKSAEEYQAARQDGFDSWVSMMRKSEAENWREARRVMRGMCPGAKTRFLNYWNHHGCPGRGYYALDILRGFCIKK